MDVQEIIETVGPERYRRAAESTQEEARYFGVTTVAHPVAQSTAQLDDNHRLTKEIEDLIMGSALSDLGKMALLLEVYRDLPNHYLLYGIALNWPDFGQAAHDLFWQTAQEILDGENEAWARPLDYALDMHSFGRPPE